MGVTSLNDLAVEGTLNTNKQTNKRTNVWEEMLARNCPKFSAIHDPGYDNRKNKNKFTEEYASLDHI